MLVCRALLCAYLGRLATAVPIPNPTTHTAEARHGVELVECVRAPNHGCFSWWACGLQRRFTTTTNDANEAIRNNRIPHPGVLPREVTSKLRGWSSLAEGNKNAPQHQQPRETIAFTSMKDANHYQLASPGSNPRSKEMFRTK